ncbi:diguanylate cyclase domain-containing protein [Tritonibacter mobilis]|uniref:diguanylate cyclase domain-containing protein n=1 Tax=Tritonibacter mobilis TaxID=379347 RepID=UPI003A5BAF6B
MKINTITNWAYGLTVLLTALSGAAFIASINSSAEERMAVETHLILNELGEELAIGAELRTDEARLYVMRGDPDHLEAFERTDQAEMALEESARDGTRLGTTPEETAFLNRIIADIDALQEMERAAIKAYQAGNIDRARGLLFGGAHYQAHLKLIDDVVQFRRMVQSRTDRELDTAHQRSDWFEFVAQISLALTATVFLGVLYFVLRRRVAVPLARMAGIVKRLASQDYEVEVPLDRRRDEIGELNRAVHVFRENGLERERLDAERRRDIKIKDLILKLMHRVQACQSLDELGDVLARYAPQIFPDLSGTLYLRADGHETLNCVSRWQTSFDDPLEIICEACWALRRGRAHYSALESKEDVICNHLADPNVSTLCIPLAAQGETIGLLSFSGAETSTEVAREDRVYLELIAENVALAAVNLNLRTRLSQLVEHDPLTGLLNRRSLDVAFGDFVQNPPTLPTACLMIDIDHFKRINDEFGHEAGDTVMQSFAGLLREVVGDSGSCYRFGGEEFVVILPDHDVDAAHEIAEDIRTRTAKMAIAHRGQSLGKVTISIGLAVAASAGALDTLLSRADSALLQAKVTGRNITLHETLELAPS